MTRLHVTVAWASPAAQELVTVILPEGTTVADAFAASKLSDGYGSIVAIDRIGINGRLARIDSVLTDGDRVEIYRPLIADPKEIRRARARSKPVPKKPGRP
jgi:putative ubiquitin-RnfH superfamily antitoxin RatB of RatAB toxin-antitoxin module